MYWGFSSLFNFAAIVNVCLHLLAIVLVAINFPFHCFRASPHRICLIKILTERLLFQYGRKVHPSFVYYFHFIWFFTSILCVITGLKATIRQTNTPHAASLWIQHMRKLLMVLNSNIKAHTQPNERLPFVDFNVFCMREYNYASGNNKIIQILFTTSNDKKQKQK